jgi:transposase
MVEPNAAGVDVGAREMYGAIPPDRDAEPVRVFPTFTADLEALADWLVDRGITTVAMESTRPWSGRRGSSPGRRRTE